MTKNSVERLAIQLRTRTLAHTPASDVHAMYSHILWALTAAPSLQQLVVHLQFMTNLLQPPGEAKATTRCMNQKAHFTSRFHVVVLIPLPKRRFFVPSFRWTHLWSLYDLIVSCGKGCLLRNKSKFLSVAALKWKLPVITNPVLYQLYIPCFQFIWLGHETDSQSLFGSKCKTVVISALSTRVIEVKFKKLLSKKLGAIEICHLLLVSSLHKWTD